jgi:hypothetical protein
LTKHIGMRPEARSGAEPAVRSSVKPSSAANDNLIERTTVLWQPRLGRELTREERPANRRERRRVLFHPARVVQDQRQRQSRQPLPHPARRAVTAETIAQALDGQKAGGCWMARCPAHDDREPSLSITDSQPGKVLVRCHAGCDQEHVIAALKSRGLWMENSPHRFTGSAPAVVADDQSDRDNAKRTEAALVLWPRKIPLARSPRI